MISFFSGPGTHPRYLTTISIENTPQAVRLNWQPPLLPNGQITGYLVFYTTDPNQEDIRWVMEGVVGERLTTTIKGLTPDTTYYFKIQARNSKGYGPISSTVIFKTPKGKSMGLLISLGPELILKEESPGYYLLVFVLLLGRICHQVTYWDWRCLII